MLTCVIQFQLNSARIRRNIYLSFWAEANDMFTPLQHHFHHCEQSEGVYWKIDMRLMSEKGSPLVSQEEKLAAAILKHFSKSGEGAVRLV